MVALIIEMSFFEVEGFEVSRCAAGIAPPFTEKVLSSHGVDFQ